MMLDLDWVTVKTASVNSQEYVFQFGKNYKYRRIAGATTLIFSLNSSSPALYALAEASGVCHNSSPTNSQVDFLLNLGRNYDSRVELFPGWSVHISLGGSVQEWLQTSAYGLRRCKEVYEKVYLA